MVIMKEFLKLIRWYNLLIVILTMVLMRYAIIEPLLEKINIKLLSIAGNANTMELQMPWYDFLILVAATVFLAAGGYVINDYFDIKTDLINRGKVTVGTKISRRQAMMWHNIFNIAGVAAGFYISWKTGDFWMGGLFLVVSGLLYFYSASYKRQFLIGNLVVAILTALVPMLVVFYEATVLYQYYEVYAVKSPDASIIFYWVGGFAVFAFLTTLTREIIKDIEDFEGDAAYGRNTLPVVIGMFASRIVAISLTIIIIILLTLVWYFLLSDIITLIYLSLVVALPLSYVIYQLIIGHNKVRLHRAGRIMKVVMITGILYSVVVRLIITHNLF
jgi:4-hydroxybenzoate polyprenyltransferase